ncbi:wings apart-like protein homolog [Octopus sinensis]|uniref:Wings apart-like protein homolog n=1 Tax=Octopus sinensis TaxID=2607531 RepID=A0A7E6ENL7_9MOLL|nr:wings apart-like protein homolog [Octopus sinensis]
MKRCAMKTYGRSSESASSRAFDDIIHNKNNKSLTVKASPLIQKWGKTSFTAVRGRRERDPEAKIARDREMEVSKRTRFDDDISDDPFSFESEDLKGTSRSSITMVPLHSNASQKNIIVTAPAVGIVTKKNFNEYNIDPAAVKPLPNTDPDKVLYRSAKTYSVSPTKRTDNMRQSTIDQFTNLHNSPQERLSLDSSPQKMTIKVSDYSYSQKFFLSPNNSGVSTQHSNSPEPSSCITLSAQSSPEKLISVLSNLPPSEENTDDDSYKFKRKPIFRTYTNHKLPVSVVPTSSPSKHMVKSTTKTKAPISAHASNTVLCDTQDSFTNSTVISRSEVKNKRGTTIIFLCKPKGMDNIKSLKKTPRETASELFDKIIKKKSVNVSEEKQPNIISPSSPVFSESSDEGPPPLSPEEVRKGLDEIEKGGSSQLNFAEVDVEMFNDHSDEESIKLFSLDDKDDSTGSDGPSKKEVNSTNVLKHNEYDDLFKLDEDDDFDFMNDSCNSVSNSNDRDSPNADIFDLDDDTYDKSLTMKTAKTYTRQTTKEKPTERKIFKSKNTRYSISGSGQTKLLSKSPKKSPSKAVYNARSWVMDMDEDIGQKGDEGPSSARPGKPTSAPSNNSSSQSSTAKTSTDKTVSKSGTEVPANVVIPKLTRKVHWPCRVGDEAFTSLKVSKEHKELFTVVRNVKEAHEVQESGETQEFMDDVEYLLAGLGDTQPMSTRCLSAFGIASKCTMPAFRMHLRAHGCITKIFTALHDASSNPSLALSTATLMFMLMRDRLSYDVGQDTLSLIVQLLEMESDSDLDNTEYVRMKDKVMELYKECHKIGMAKQIDLESISTGNLAMESLLTIAASRNASDVFKNELRSLGALDHIVNAVCSCVESLESHYINTMDHAHRRKLEKVDRCLRVLESVTVTNIENQSFLISYKQCALVNSLNTTLRHCQSTISNFPLRDDPDRPSESSLDKESNGWIIFSCMLAILRVLLNLTHENDYGCTKIGSQRGLIQTVFDCILQVPQYTLMCKQFDLLVLSLGLLINLVEHCVVNRRLLITMETLRPPECSIPSEKLGAVEALVDLFCRKELAAREMEAQEEEEGSNTEGSSPNKSGNWHESDSCLQWIVGTKRKEAEKQNEQKHNGEDESHIDATDAEEKFTKALHEAGKHMENSFVAAYVALLIGCLIQDNRSNVEKVKEYLPNGFEPMIRILKKFLGFMNLTSASGGSGSRSIARVIETLEAC